MRRAAFPLGLAAATLAAIATHLGSLAAPFFADDWLFLDQVGTRSFLGSLASPDPLGNFFRPLSRQAWFWLLAHTGGNSPFVFHAANLACFVVAVVLLGLLTRRVAGPQAGVVAAAFLALHYAADVPVLWVSGSQELLSLTFALGALALYTSGRRAAAALALLLALLAKEVVVLAPLAAIALDAPERTFRERVRRAWPLYMSVAAWLALATIAMGLRGTPGAGLSLSASGPIAAPVLLLRVVLGLEWLTGSWPWADFVVPSPLVAFAVLLAAVAVWFAAPSEPAAAGPTRAATGSSQHARRAQARAREAAPKARAVPRGANTTFRAGLVWMLAGALPVAVVAPLWSGYYFLFAVAGAGLALGSIAARLRWSGATSALVLVLLGLASARARSLEEFATAPSPWSAQGHVNRFYLERGMRVVARGLSDLEQQAPRPEPRTTFFFAGLPSFAAFQSADGPLLRVTYADTTLRGYYLSQMSLDKLARGPRKVFFYDNERGHLEDHTQDPGVYMSTALGMILGGNYEVAEAALQAARAIGRWDNDYAYVAGMVALARGDRALALARFEQAGRFARGGGATQLRDARARLEVGDSLGALVAVRAGLRADVLNPELHALAADLLLKTMSGATEGRLESFAVTLLAGERPGSWLRWGFVLTRENRHSEAIAALDRYTALLPAGTAPDELAVRLRALLERALPGGDLAQRAMRRELVR